MLYSAAAYTPGRVRYICVSLGRTEGCIVYALHHVRLRVGWTFVLCACDNCRVVFYFCFTLNVFGVIFGIWLSGSAVRGNNNGYM